MKSKLKKVISIILIGTIIISALSVVIFVPPAKNIFDEVLYANMIYTIDKHKKPLTFLFLKNKYNLNNFIEPVDGRVLGMSNSLYVKNMVPNKMQEIFLKENEKVFFTCLYKYTGENTEEYGKSEVTTLEILYFFETDKKRQISFVYTMEEKTLYHTTNYQDFPEYSEGEIQNIANNFLKNIFVAGWVQTNHFSRFSKDNYGKIIYKDNSTI